jgi:hypothetical protein
MQAVMVPDATTTEALKQASVVVAVCKQYVCTIKESHAGCIAAAAAVAPELPSSCYCAC